MVTKENTSTLTNVYMFLVLMTWTLLSQKTTAKLLEIKVAILKGSFGTGWDRQSYFEINYSIIYIRDNLSYYYNINGEINNFETN